MLSERCLAGALVVGRGFLELLHHVGAEGRGDASQKLGELRAVISLAGVCAAAWSRWLHLYLSMLSFLVVLFFAITGLTLNHVDWFDGQQTERKAMGTVPAAWVSAPDTAAINKLALAELLRKITTCRVTSAIF